MLLRTKKPLILFAGGGSGGHLFPGIALAEEFESVHGWRVAFLSTSKKVEETIFSEYDFPVQNHSAPALPKKALGLPGFAFKLIRAVAQAERVVQEMKPTAVVGLGGYGSFAPVAAAARRGIPTFILEQNAVPGKANRMLSAWTTKVFSQFESARKNFRRPRRVEVLGNPLRERVEPMNKFIARYKLGLNLFKRTILVLGGSQGARPINRIFMKSAEVFKNYPPCIQVLHLSGDKDNSELAEKYREGGVRAVVRKFLHEMELAYSAADLIVTRAGGTTLAEIAALGIPAVLVPLPHAADDHQRKNAREYAASGAACIIEEKDLTPETIASGVIELILDDRKLESLARAAAFSGSMGARTAIAERIVEMVTGKPITYIDSMFERRA